MPEWILGFISGIIATVIGFVLTMLWDVSKSNKEIQEKEKQIMLVFKEELKYNLFILSKNMDLIDQELKIIDSRQSIVNPLTILKTGFWDLLKFHLPKKLTEKDTLKTVSEVVQFSEEFNEIIRSRENFRNNNRALTSYGLQMKSYDEILVKSMGNLIEVMKKLPSFLELF